MISDLLEEMAGKYGANVSYAETYKKFGNELLEKILAKNIDTDKEKRISQLYGRLYEATKLMTRYKTALEKIKDHHPRCECMDSGGIASEALEHKFGDYIWE
jgi:hypothetical protein